MISPINVQAVCPGTQPHIEVSPPWPNLKARASSKLGKGIKVGSRKGIKEWSFPWFLSPTSFCLNSLQSQDWKSDHGRANPAPTVPWALYLPNPYWASQLWPHHWEKWAVRSLHYTKVALFCFDFYSLCFPLNRVVSRDVLSEARQWLSSPYEASPLLLVSMWCIC